MSIVDFVGVARRLHALNVECCDWWWSWGTSKQHMRLQQQQNCNFRVSPFKPPEVPKSSRPWHYDFSTWPSLTSNGCTHNNCQTTAIASQHRWNDNLPDPPTLAFLEKARVFSQKSKGFSLRGTPKILGKERKNAPREQGKSENEKSKEIERSKDWRVRAFLPARMQQLVGNIFLIFCWEILREIWLKFLVHQNRTIAITSDFRIDGAKSPEIPQKEGAWGSEIATWNRKSLATFHRTLKSQCKVSEIASDIWGPRWASQSQIAKIAAISVC